MVCKSVTRSQYCFERTPRSLACSRDLVTFTGQALLCQLLNERSLGLALAKNITNQMRRYRHYAQGDPNGTMIVSESSAVLHDITPQYVSLASKQSEAKQSKAKRSNVKQTKRSEAKRSKQSEAKRSEAKRSEAKRSEAKRSEAKRSEAKRAIHPSIHRLIDRRVAETE